MSREGKGKGEGRLGRWSRLKRQGQAVPVGRGAAAPKPPAPLAEPAPEDPAGRPADATPPEAAEFDVASLPSVDELERDSDYTPFLAKGVPEDLARMAMRKLWLSDPAFGIRDGLDDYDEDFTVVHKILTALNEGGKKVDEAVKEEAREEEAATPGEAAEAGNEPAGQPAAEGREDGGDNENAAVPAGGKMDTGGENVVSDGPAATAAAEKNPQSNGDRPKREGSG